MTHRWCKVCRGWHDVNRPWPTECLPEEPLLRADYAAPAVIGDGMAPVQSMLDGKFYDSKAALRKTYKAAGVTEVGNDSSVVAPKPVKRNAPDKAEIRKATAKAFARVGIPL